MQLDGLSDRANGRRTVAEQLDGHRRYVALQSLTVELADTPYPVTSLFRLTQVLDESVCNSVQRTPPCHVPPLTAQPIKIAADAWIEDGAGTRIRTGDLPLTRRLLYQLSYAGEGRRIARRCAF